MYEDYKYMYGEYQILKREKRVFKKKENKLQLIEQLFKNEPVDLTKLAKIIKEVE